MNATYRIQPVNEVEVFYREYGPTVPVVLLSHGCSTSSHYCPPSE